MDYVNIPTCVFTPLEYGSCGFTEEEAIAKFSDANIEVYHTEFKPLEWAYNKMSAGGKRVSYVKVIVNTADNERVVGFHIACPNAGEITQGIGVAMKCNVTRSQLNSTVGIHPTVAEECLSLKATKRSDPNASRTGC